MDIWINARKIPAPLDVQEQSLLNFLRNNLGLTGTRHGCGMGLCGACTVHLEGRAIRSCQTPIHEVAGKRVTTIEGLAPDQYPHPVQKAFLEMQAPQCGFCMSGQIMSASALLAQTPNPSRSQIDQALNGNLCRCGAYGRIRKAIQMAARGES